MENSDEIIRELSKLNQSVSTIGDAVRVGVRDGMKQANADARKQRSDTDDTELAQKANDKILLRVKSDYMNDMYKSKDKDPDLDAKQKSLKSQVESSVYLQQLLKLTKENQEYDKKRDNDKKDKSLSDRLLGITTNIAQYKNDNNQPLKLVANIAEMGLGFRDIFKGIKSKASGSDSRQKKISKGTNDLNKEKALLSAEEAKLEKLKKARGKDRDPDAIKRMQAKVDNRKEGIKGKADSLSDIMQKEAMYQKGLNNKAFRFKGEEKDLVAEQLKGNMKHDLLKDVFPDKTPKKPKEVGGASNIGPQLSKSFDKLDKILDKHNNSFSKLMNRQTDSLSKIMDKQNTALSKLMNRQTDPSSKEMDKQNSPTSKGIDDSTKKSKLFDKKDDKSNAPISIFDTKLNNNANPNTAGEYIVGIYNQLKKKEPPRKEKESFIPPPESGGGGGLGSFLIPALVAGGGALLANLVQNKLKQVLGIGDASAGGNIADDAVLKGGKTALNVASKAGVKALSKEGAKVAGKQTIKTVAKTAGKNVLKGAGKSALKKVPILGLGAGLLFGAQRAMKGDYMGGMMEVASGGLSLIPGIGTGASIAMDAALMGRDVYKETNKGENKPNVPTGKPVIIPPKTGLGNPPSDSTKEYITPKSDSTAISNASGMDQMTSMTIQAKLIAAEINSVNKSVDSINRQKEISKAGGQATADKLMGQ